ncbi:hypothetical protein ACH5RR_039361 [Cinchona calisaya]|uniref:Uncharacterized protein n=1 Tax=Cinchona calisaya TaxID=153742 RepID=A0ABD2Y3M2_9GENT
MEEVERGPDRLSGGWEKVMGVVEDLGKSRDEMMRSEISAGEKTLHKVDHNAFSNVEQVDYKPMDKEQEVKTRNPTSLAHQSHNTDDILICPKRKILVSPKKKIKNKACIEAVEEVTTFASYYFEPHVQSKRQRAGRNDEGPVDPNVPSFSIFNYLGRSAGACKRGYLIDDERRIAHIYILLNCPEVEPYVQMFRSSYYGVPDHRIDQMCNENTLQSGSNRSAHSKVEEHWKDTAYQQDRVVAPIEPELHDIPTLQDPSGEVVFVDEIEIHLPQFNTTSFNEEEEEDDDDDDDDDTSEDVEDNDVDNDEADEFDFD